MRSEISNQDHYYKDPLTLAYKTSSELGKEYPHRLKTLLSQIRYKIGKSKSKTIINEMYEIHQLIFGQDAPIIGNFINLITQNKAMYDQIYHLISVLKDKETKIQQHIKQDVQFLFKKNQPQEINCKLEIINRLEKGELDLASEICQKCNFKVMLDLISEIKQYRWLTMRNNQYMENTVGRLKEWKLPNLQFSSQRQVLKQFLETIYAKAYKQGLDLINIEQTFYIQKSFSQTCQILDYTFRQQRIRSILKNEYQYFQNEKWFNKFQKLVTSGLVKINGETIKKIYFERQEERLPKLYQLLQRIINTVKRKDESRTTIDSVGSSISQMPMSKIERSQVQYPQQRHSPTKSYISTKPQPSLIDRAKNSTILEQAKEQFQNSLSSIDPKNEQVKREINQRQQFFINLQEEKQKIINEIKNLQQQRSFLFQKSAQLKNNIVELRDQCDDLKYQQIRILQNIKIYKTENEERQKLISQLQQNIQQKIKQQSQLKVKIQKIINNNKGLIMQIISPKPFQDVSISSSNSSQASLFCQRSSLLSHQDQIILKNQLFKILRKKVQCILVYNQSNQNLKYYPAYQKINSLRHILLVVKIKTKTQQTKIISAYFQHRSPFQQKAIISEIYPCKKQLNYSQIQSQISSIPNQESFLIIPDQIQQSLQQIEEGFICTHWNSKMFIPVKKVKLFNVNHQKSLLHIGKSDLTINFKQKKVISQIGLGETAFAHTNGRNISDKISLFESSSAKASIQSLELFEVKFIK